VPEQFSFVSERALIAATGNKGISRAQVLSFNRLSYYVFSKTGGLDRKILEESGRHMLLRKIVNEQRSKLVYFKTGHDKKGFIDELASSITEFYQYGIEPENLKSQAQAQAQAQAETTDNAGLKLKLNDLHLIYSEYRNFLLEKYISGDEILDILAEKIPEAGFLAGAEIWIDGFKSFTPQEKKVLRSLISVASSVKFTFCVDRKLEKFEEIAKTDAFYEVKDSIEQIDRMCLEIGAKLGEHIFLDTPYRHTNAPDLQFLCSHFIGFSEEQYEEKPKNIRIFSAPNNYSEIHAAAKAVVMLARDRGYRYSDIGIVCTDLNLYEKYLPPIFSQYNIPVFMDTRRDILGHPLAQLIFAALETISTNWKYEAVFSMLRSALANIPREEIDVLENYVLAYNIRGKAWQEEFVLGSEEELTAANEVRVKLINFMEPLSNINSYRVKYPLEEISICIYNFLKKNGIDAAIEGLAEKARQYGDNEALRRHEQAWGRIIDTLDKMIEILGDAKESVGGYSKILEAGAMNLGLAPPSLDQLVAGDLRRSRFGEIKALILLGANEGLMPSRPQATGVLDDNDRANLEASGISLAKDSIAKIYEEEFLIYTGLSKPQEYLAIIYNTGNLEGKANSPSRLIERIKAMLPKINITELESLDENSISNISCADTAFGGLIAALGQSSALKEPVAPVYMDAYGYFKEDEVFSEKLENIRQAAQFHSCVHALSKDAAKNLYGKRIRTSASKLERYISCPFSYFVEYNLAAQNRRLYEVAAVDIGNVYHDILAKFGNIVKTTYALDSQDKKEFGDLIDQSVKQVIDSQDILLKSSGKYRYYADKIKQISEVSIQALVEHIKRGDFDLSYNEVAFSDNASGEEGIAFGSIQIPLDKQISLLLDGRIDRVDIGGIDGKNYVKIIDYKSGRKSFSLSECYYGLDMQLLIYLSAFIQKLAQSRGSSFAESIMPAAAFYFRLQNPFVLYGKHLHNEPENLQKELLKAFKMSGIVLEEDAVVYGMDKELSGDSDILPVGFKKSKDGEASFKKTSATISAEGFLALMEHVMNLAKQAGKDIYSGDISIAPTKHKNETPCRYCSFRSVCKFDANSRQSYRDLRFLGNEEVLNKILECSND